MALTSEDREWLENQFTRLHERIDERVEANHDLALEVTRLQMECPQMKAHEEKHHNPKKTWGLIGTIIAACVGAVELLKHFMKGDKS